VKIFLNIKTANLQYCWQLIKLMQRVMRDRNALNGFSDEQLLDIGKTKCEALREIQQGYRIPKNRRVKRA
jgi:uncharacterized protein YjiS (DUF1127 family)